jgi:hypothetical protein
MTIKESYKPARRSFARCTESLLRENLALFLKHLAVKLRGLIDPECFTNKQQQERSWLKKLLETIIAIQDVEVELYDRAAGEFDQMLADNLHQARVKLESIYQKINA